MLLTHGLPLSKGKSVARPTDEQIIITILDQRFCSRYSDGRPDEPFGAEIWKELLEDRDAYGTRFEYGDPDMWYATAKAVRELFD